MDELKEIKLKNYQYLNEVAIKGETLFTGSSLMELFPICEIARSRGVDDIIYNRGISGLNTDEFLQHIHPLLLDLQPSKVFINIGTNDTHTHIVFQNRAVCTAAQSNRLAVIGWNTGSQRATSRHQTISMIHQRRNDQIQSFQTSCTAHDITMIERQHDCAPVSRKNL